MDINFVNDDDDISFIPQTQAQDIILPVGSINEQNIQQISEQKSAEECSSNIDLECSTSDDYNLNETYTNFSKVNYNITNDKPAVEKGKQLFCIQFIKTITVNTKINLNYLSRK